MRCSLWLRMVMAVGWLGISRLRLPAPTASGSSPAAGQHATAHLCGCDAIRATQSAQMKMR